MTRLTAAMYPYPTISIHILTRRMTQLYIDLLEIASDFNPHPHTEDDTARRLVKKVLNDFNPHPHTEDDAVPAAPCPAS